MNSIELTLEAGRVVRFHNSPIDRKQSVGEHSWGVAALVLYLTGGEASANLLKAAIFHDCAEVEIGDIPAPTKWKHQLMREYLHELEDVTNHDNGWHVDLEIHERVVLKWADVLEGIAYCNDRIAAGDARAKIVKARWVEFADNMPAHERAIDLLNNWRD